MAGCNLVPRACDPREGTQGSGIIRFREESDWPLKWNVQFNLSQDSWLPATDYPRASRSFPRIAGSGSEIGRDVSKNQVGFGIIREILAGSGIFFHRGKWDS